MCLQSVKNEVRYDITVLEFLNSRFRVSFFVAKDIRDNKGSLVSGHCFYDRLSSMIVTSKECSNGYLRLMRPSTRTES